MDAAPLAGTEILLVDVEDGIATLTLNRPSQFNALSTELIGAIQSALKRIASNHAIRVVVLAANGRGFCSGHDLKEIRALADRASIEALFTACSDMMLAIGALPQAVIAKVHGTATAAGCQLVAACDLAIAAEGAKFATPGVNLGTFCSTPSVAIGRSMARKHAMELLLTGEFISAARAREIGLVNSVVAHDDLDAETARWARLIASKSASAIATGKRVFNAHMAMDIENAYAFASHEIACEFLTPNGQEGVDAFLAKRAPRWT